MLKQSTARNLMRFLVDSSDHVTGKTGLTLTITASKNGAAFASISPTVTERGDGWYSIALTTAHTDTLGDLAFHITATGADPLDFIEEVVAALPGEWPSTAQINAEVVDALATDTYAEPASVPAATASLKDKIGWLFTLARNKITQTSTTQTVRNDADDATIATSTVSDNGTTFTRGEYS